MSASRLVRRPSARCGCICCNDVASVPVGIREAEFVVRSLDLAGAAHLVLADGVVLLHPEPAVFEAMLTGWRQQQESRLLGVDDRGAGSDDAPVPGVHG